MDITLEQWLEPTLALISLSSVFTLVYFKSPIIWNDIPANILAVGSFSQLKSLWKAYI